MLQNHEIQKQLELYIPVQGARGLFAKSKNHKPFDLDNVFNDFLSNDKKVLLLLGEGGTGKTTFCLNLAYTFSETWKAGQPVPLYIPLALLNNPFTNIIDEYLSKLDLNEKQIEELKDKHSFLLILDGYDEINQDKPHNLYETNEFDRLKNKPKVIITCRTSHLRNDNNYAIHFMPPSHMLQGFQEDAYDEVTTLPFEATQINDYIKKFIEKGLKGKLQSYEEQWYKQETYQEYIRAVPGLNELVKNAFLLNITLNVLPEIAARYEKRKPNEIILYTGRELLKEYVESWFKRQEIKLRGKKMHPENIFHEYNNFCEKLAYQMNLDGLHIVTYKPLQSDEPDEQTKKYQPFFGSTDKLKQLAFDGAPLRKPGINQHAFLHDNIQSHFNRENSLAATEELPLDEDVPTGSCKCIIS